MHAIRPHNSDVDKVTSFKAKAKATILEAKTTTNATITKAKAKAINAKATATCCRSTARVRQRTTDESNTRNLFNNGEQSPNCYSVMGNHS